MAVARPAIMPHVSSSGGGDDLGSEDEVKVFKDEGEDEKRSSENLTEEKSSLIDLTESEVRATNPFCNRQLSPLSNPAKSAGPVVPRPVVRPPAVSFTRPSSP